MCGGRGFGRGITMAGCSRHDFEAYSISYRGRYASEDMTLHWLEEKIRRMYALGELSREQYRDTLDQFDRGQFGEAEFRRLRRSIEEKKDLTSDQPGDKSNIGRRPNLNVDTDVEKGITDLKANLAQVREEKQNVISIIASINGAIKKLKDQMALDENAAKEVIGSDEGEARKFLRHRQELGEQVTGLDARLKELSYDLLELEQVEMRLDTKQLELHALAQRERVLQLADNMGN